MHGMVMPLVAGTISVLVYRRGRLMRLIRIPAGVRAAIAAVLLAALSPLHEKNALKTVAVRAPPVLKGNHREYPISALAPRPASGRRRWSRRPGGRSRRAAILRSACLRGAR